YSKTASITARAWDWTVPQMGRRCGAQGAITLSSLEMPEQRKLARQDVDPIRNDPNCVKKRTRRRWFRRRFLLRTPNHCQHADGPHISDNPVGAGGGSP